MAGRALPSARAPEIAAVLLSKPRRVKRWVDRSAMRGSPCKLSWLYAVNHGVGLLPMESGLRRFSLKRWASSERLLPPAPRADTDKQVVGRKTATLDAQGSG